MAPQRRALALRLGDCGGGGATRRTPGATVVRLQKLTKVDPERLSAALVLTFKSRLRLQSYFWANVKMHPQGAGSPPLSCDLDGCWRGASLRISSQFRPSATLV